MKIFKKLNDNILYSPNSSLTELANKYETDKGNANTDTLSWGSSYPNYSCWGYTLTYEKYMSEFKNKDINFLEIGICDKRFPYASPKMWLSYFSNIDLYCVDNFWGHTLENKLEEIEQINKIGVNFIYADQGSYEDWKELKKLCKFDFIVEDGSHWPNHMMVSLWQSIDTLKSGGFYFMEDIQNPLKSRGWFRYDNALIAEEFLRTLTTKELKSSFLNDQQNKDVNENFELVDLVLDVNEVNYLAVLKKK